MTRMKWITGFAIPAAMTCLVWVGTAGAHSGLGPEEAADLETLTESSNLIVHGTVIGVEYVNATTDEEDIPYTHVTYQLQETLRGRAEGDTLTLQFVGGADGKGAFLFVSGVPTFQEGDEDILFVRGNGEDDNCPLVHCEYGRFRIDRGKVYNTHGQPLRGMKDNHAIARGERAARFQTLKYPAPEFDDLIKTEEAKAILKERGMSVEAARADYAKNAPEEIEIILGAPEATRPEDRAEPDPQDQKARSETKPGRSEPTERGIGAEPISKESFISKAKGLERAAKRRPTAVKSARTGVPVRARRVAAASPGRPPKPEPRPRQASPEDEAEVQALEAQGFNPVLTPRKPNPDN